MEQPIFKPYFLLGMCLFLRFPSIYSQTDPEHLSVSQISQSASSPPPPHWWYREYVPLTNAPNDGKLSEEKSPFLSREPKLPAWSLRPDRPLGKRFPGNLIIPVTPPSPTARVRFSELPKSEQTLSLWGLLLSSIKLLEDQHNQIHQTVEYLTSNLQIKLTNLEQKLSRIDDNLSQMLLNEAQINLSQELNFKKQNTESCLEKKLQLEDGWLMNLQKIATNIQAVANLTLEPSLDLNPDPEYPIPNGMAHDCAQIQAQLQRRLGDNWTEEMAANESTLVQQIWPLRSLLPVMVSCQFTTVGPAWTIFQRRSDSSINFNRVWSEYRAGFGHIPGDHWLGLETLYRLTNQRVYQLRVELESFEGDRASANYGAFAIGSEEEAFPLKVLGLFTGGAAGDALSYHAGMKFSTRDRDNDLLVDDSCAAENEGGWWYRMSPCGSTNLNGVYLNRAEGATGYGGVYWSDWMGTEVSLKKVTMKVRPLVPKEEAGN